MARIAGIKEHKSASGKVTSITIDLKKWGDYLEDFLDMIKVERIKNSSDGEVVATHAEIKKMLAKKLK
ncbi:MAG: hypothetical protein KF900_12620 [Bacteroidetes bacterium]|nr:hypothetical protein [Bacteroidota bacterium]